MSEHLGIVGLKFKCDPYRLQLIQEEGMEEKRKYHLWDDHTINEIKNLIIAIGKEMNFSDQTWFTTAEAAEYLRCSTRTIGRAVSLG